MWQFRVHHSNLHPATLEHQGIEGMERETKTIQGMMATVRIVMKNMNAAGKNVSIVRVGDMGPMSV